MKKLTIIGAGLCGSLLALYMHKRGYEIDLFESREDLRLDKSDKGRSINLALSCRGITGLKAINLLDEVKDIIVPMRARAIHFPDGQIKYQPFGRHPDEHINAILRNALNEILLNKIETAPSIKLHFNMKLINCDFEKKLLYFENKKSQIETVGYSRLIGADGAASALRDCLIKEKRIEGERQFLPHSYKELSIAKEHSKNFKPEHLHLWPRNSFMLLGNPNKDNSITGTLFLPNEGKNSFADLQDEASVDKFFKAYFKDAYEAMPDLINEFFTHPTGHLSTIKCANWYLKDECLLIGDAAHGVIPFFGQGMNSAFEDCRILNQLLDKFEDNWSLVMPAFFKERKPNTDAVAAMSMDNYHEIQTDIGDNRFNLRKRIEQELMHRYPKQYISKHVLVMFSNTPYEEARKIGELQSTLLSKISDDIEQLEDIDWHKVSSLVSNYANKLAINGYKIENI
ncbi:MAG: FAD-dependent monooxygenase [Proteobacteria bacterium]|nr:FAD-dependent monooxygenase [Pseudomonadota bacterium]